LSDKNDDAIDEHIDERDGVEEAIKAYERRREKKDRT